MLHQIPECGETCKTVHSLPGILYHDYLGQLMERGDALCSSYKRIRQLKIKPAPHGDDQGIPFPPGGQGRDTGS